MGTLPNGNSTTTCGGGTDTCPNIIWPGKSQTVDGLLTSHDPINQWWGSLITNKLDASGYKYMRNRYYNPATGHFTQQDPIGLAGGLNLYGFAGGDPVNYSDPFGLEKLSEQERQKLGNQCDQVNCDKVEVHRGNDGRVRNFVRKAVLKVSGGRSVTLGNRVYLAGDDAHDIPTLAHEVTHVGQYQQWGALKYFGRGSSARVTEMRGGDPYALPNPLPADVPFGAYGMEQQGQIVEKLLSSRCWLRRVAVPAAALGGDDASHTFARCPHRRSRANRLSREDCRMDRRWLDGRAAELWSW